MNICCYKNKNKRKQGYLTLILSLGLNKNMLQFR